MELILQQMPVVVHSLNIGFIQTLKLFFVTLIGAFPLGLIIAFGSMSRFRPLSYFTKVIVWVVRGTPLMIQLLIIYYFPGLVLGNAIWGGGETGRFAAAAVSFIFNYACYFSEIYRGGIQSVPVGQEEAGLVLGMTRTQIFFKITLLQMIKRIVPPMSNHSGKGYFSCKNHCTAGDYLGRTGIYERFPGNFGSYLAVVLYSSLLSDLQWCADRITWQTGEETGLFQVRGQTRCQFWK